MGTSFQATATIPPADHTLQKPDILALIHAAAAQGGAGLTHIYHVFLPQGVDVCFRALLCYSPDVPAAFTFCALHNSAVFSDLGLVLYSLEPYQNVPGCSAPPHTTPNGQTADSTYYSLSHEVFETITDPVVEQGWAVHEGQIAAGQEMADLCTFSAYGADGNLYSSAPNSKLNGNHYVIQAEYSNLVHGCLYPAASDGNK